jgi:hypothetical protein
MVKTVWFWYPEENEKSFLQIRNDETGKRFNDALSPASPPIFIKVTRSWDNGQNIAPVAYVSGFTPRINALFQIENINSCNIDGLSVKGEVFVDGVLIAVLPTKVLDESQYYPISSFFLPPPATSKFVFEKYVVKNIPELKIKWYSSSTPETTSSWKNAGETFHRFYITHNVPSNGNSAYLETCLAISCVNANDKGLLNQSPNPDEILLTIFDEFRDRCVMKRNGTNCMKYWGDESIANACLNTFGLIQNEDAACGIWVDFLDEILRSQGIKNTKPKLVWYGETLLGGVRGRLSDSQANQCDTDIDAFFLAEKDKVFFLDPQTPYSAIFVKNNAFDSSTKFYLDESGDDVVIPGSGKSIKYAGGEGIPAQGNDNPISNFSNHAILECSLSNNSVIYFDPSYGTPTPNQQSFSLANTNEWENMSMAGYGTYLRYYKNGIDESPIIILWVHEIENNTIQAKYSN